MRKITILGLCLVLLGSCKDIIETIENIEQNGDNAATTTYLIQKGAHSSSPSGYKTLKGDTLTFRVMFDSSAIYTTVDPSNQGDINKLWGISDCGSHHQTNSARFGWRWHDKKLQIFAYCYVNEVRKYELIDTVSINSWNDYKLIILPENYKFILNKTEKMIIRGCDNEAKGYKLYPYFGGDETAPHEIKIIIKE